MSNTYITIRVEYEDKTSRKDLGVQAKLTLEEIRQSKFDLVCYTVHKLFDMINKAQEEELNARSTGANT